MAASEVEIPVGIRHVTLYFSAASADSLTAERRQILEPASVSENVRSLIEELGRGPRDGQLRAGQQTLLPVYLEPGSGSHQVSGG